MVSADTTIGYFYAGMLSGHDRPDLAQLLSIRQYIAQYCLAKGKTLIHTLPVKGRYRT